MTRKAKPGSGEDYSKIKFIGLDVVSGRKRLRYLAQVFGLVIMPLWEDGYYRRKDT